MIGLSKWALLNQNLQIGMKISNPVIAFYSNTWDLSNITADSWLSVVWAGLYDDSPWFYTSLIDFLLHLHWAPKYHDVDYSQFNSKIPLPKFKDIFKYIVSLEGSVCFFPSNCLKYFCGHVHLCEYGSSVSCGASVRGNRTKLIQTLLWRKSCNLWWKIWNIPGFENVLRKT